MKIAFAGIRHGHIFSLYDKVKADPACEIVAVGEEEPEKSLLATRPDIRLTHRNIDEMLKTCDCDVVAVGDYYAKRGSIVLRALKKGKHVIADKPLCTTLSELDEIEKIVARTGLKVGCMYELRGLPGVAGARELIHSGAIGEVLQIQFNGQHPLNRATRPAWYFEAGKHGGAINDIAGHAIDLIPYLTGHKIKEIAGARCWQSALAEGTAMRDAGEMMLTLDNDAGVLGDVSYTALDSFGFALPTYWQFRIWGTFGMVEFNTANEVKLYRAGEKGVQIVAPREKAPADYWTSFRADVAGKPLELDTETVLESNRKTLEIQRFAEEAAK